MKKLVLALAVLGTVGVAQAQSSVTIYGQLDAGFIKRTNATTAIGRGHNNILGFKGSEDLGNGLNAIFQIENRFEPDTGTVESGGRPLFQGRTVVGLSGSFGAVTLGRNLTPINQFEGDFDPFTGGRTVGDNTDIITITSTYSSDPFSAGNANTTSSSKNRFANGLFYNSPDFSGFKVAAAVTTKEAIAAIPGVTGNVGSNGDLTTTPFGVVGTYNNGPIGALLGYERNGINSKLALVAGSYDFGVVKLMADYARSTRDVGNDTKGWVIGGNAPVAGGAGSVKFSYGRLKTDGADALKRAGLGYWHFLSKRTNIYTDVTNTRPVTGDTITAFDLGIRHTF